MAKRTAAVSAAEDQSCHDVNEVARILEDVAALIRTLGFQGVPVRDVQASRARVATTRKGGAATARRSPGARKRTR